MSAWITTHTCLVAKKNAKNPSAYWNHLKIHSYIANMFYQQTCQCAWLKCSSVRYDFFFNYPYLKLLCPTFVTHQEVWGLQAWWVGDIVDVLHIQVLTDFGNDYCHQAGLHHRWRHMYALSLPLRTWLFQGSCLSYTSWCFTDECRAQ